jgi:iron complex outermembrane receptor protein
MKRGEAMQLRRKSILLGTVALGLVTTPAVHAQDAGNSGDIIVTARRTEERLQDVPISITVYSQDQIAKRNIVVAADLATYTPSLSVNQSYGPEKSSFAIRGFVQDQGTAPSVGVYFADVIEPRAQGGTTSGSMAPVGSLVDLENVQVLKGPQGTLFGRNTTGGAVLLVPHKPTDKFEGWVEGSAGDYGMWRATGVLNAPLSDTFKIRAMIDSQHRDGYMTNKSGIGPGDYGDVNYVAARLGIAADLTPDLENYLIASYSYSFTNGSANRIEKCDTNPADQTGIVPITSPMACTQIARQNARGDSLLDVDVGVPDAYQRLRQWSVINTTTWKSSDTLTIKNIASYTQFTEQASFSLEGDNFNVPSFFPTAGEPLQLIWLKNAPGRYSSSSVNFTEELQFQGRTSNDFLTWQGGFYYENSTPYGPTNVPVGEFANCVDPTTYQCTNVLGFGFVNDSYYEYRFKSEGIYAQGTLKFTDKLSMTAGARYTWDKETAVDQGTRIIFQPTGGYIRTCNDAFRFPNPDVPGQGMVVTDRSECEYGFENKSDRPTWTIDLDYKPTQDILAYAKYSRGYRQGGIDVVDIGIEQWGPEKVDAYEIGAKTGFHGALNGYFNIAAFYNNFEDQQLFASLVAKPSSGLVGGGAIINAGKSRIWGIEVDTSATVWHSLKLDVGYTYLDTKLEEINIPALDPNSPFEEIIPSATVGSQLALSPKNRVTATATYTLPLDQSVGRISFGATFVHTDQQVATLGTIPEFQNLPATDLLNLNVDWNNVLGKPVDVSFFMTNATNQIYPVSVEQSWFSFGFEGRRYAPPRMWGFRLRYSFGQ